MNSKVLQRVRQLHSFRVLTMFDPSLTTRRCSIKVANRMRREQREKLEDSMKRLRKRIQSMLERERPVSKMGYRMAKGSMGRSLRK